MPWLSLGKIILIKYEKTFDKEESLVSKTLREVQNIFVRQLQQTILKLWRATHNNSTLTDNMTQKSPTDSSPPISSHP